MASKIFDGSRNWLYHERDKWQPQQSQVEEKLEANVTGSGLPDAEANDYEHMQQQATSNLKELRNLKY